MRANAELIKSLYQDDSVASGYIDERFSKPLGRVQHKVQVELINDVIRRYQIDNVLEVACGPARLTPGITGIVNGIAIDASYQMLEIARRRMKNRREWQFVNGDAFNLNFERKFNLVYSFRFIRHLKFIERNKIYDQIREVLTPRGLFIFDAIRYGKPLFLRKHESGGKILVYDKVYKNKAKLQAELKAAGFELVKLYPCIEHFYIQAFFSRISHILKNDLLGIRIIQFLEKIKTGHPLEWIVLCQKK